MGKMTPHIRVNLTLDPKDKTRLKAIAQAHNRSQSNMVSVLIRKEYHNMREKTRQEHKE